MDPLLVRFDREPEPGFKPCNLVIVLEARLPQLWTILRLCAWFLQWNRHIGVLISVHGSKRQHTVAHELICLGKRANPQEPGLTSSSLYVPLAPSKPTLWLFNGYRRGIADRRCTLPDQPVATQRANDMRLSSFCEHTHGSRRIKQAHAKLLENGLFLCPTTIERHSAYLSRQRLQARLLGTSKVLFDLRLPENNALYIFHIDSNRTVRDG